MLEFTSPSTFSLSFTLPSSFPPSFPLFLLLSLPPSLSPSPLSLPLSLPQLCRSVVRHHQELEMQQMRTEKDELQRLRKIASSIAKEVKHFWDSIQKVGHGQPLIFATYDIT